MPSSSPSFHSSGASFQHGGPGAPAVNAPYAMPPPGPTGTLPAASELPASQRTGLSMKWGLVGAWDLLLLLC